MGISRQLPELIAAAVSAVVQPRLRPAAKKPRFEPRAFAVAMMGLAVAAVATERPANATIIEDSVNASQTPDCGCNFGATDIGWYYTPASSYELAGIDTIFASVPGSETVTEAVYSSLGGALLASATFMPDADVFSGGSFCGH
jgi:hypothetical protein